jgi:hypothetical protein
VARLLDNGSVARGFNKLLTGKYSGAAEGEVGYSQSYARFVHENLEAHHPVGQAKFLEKPARTKRPAMIAIIGKLLKEGKTPKQAVYAALLYLQGQSQALCPVDTGALRNSAYVKMK